jgi:hypothetical protein
MKATCPKNKDHKEFITTAHVAQDWKVDSEGTFLDVVEDCTDIVARPCKGNTWTCAECGTEAVVED